MTERAEHAACRQATEDETAAAVRRLWGLDEPDPNRPHRAVTDRLRQQLARQTERAQQRKEQP